MLGPVPIVRFRVENTAVSYDRVTYQIENAARPIDDITYTISRDLIDSWESDSLFFRYRAEVNGVSVPGLELGAALQIDEVPLYGYTGKWSFVVIGKNWSLTQTEKVFSRGTQVNLFLDHGVLGNVIQPTTPDYSGFVIGCDQASEDHVPVITLSCGDAASAFEKYDTCMEAEPFSGLTRRAITEVLALDAGFTTVIAPDGATYDKPLQLINKKLFDVLNSLWEPEGCYVRTSGFDTLEVIKPRLKLAPEQPDWVWHKRDVKSFRAIPPEDSPSRWVVAGTGAKVVDELGNLTETQTFIVSQEYAAKVATHRQNADGSTTDLGVEQPAAFHQMFQRRVIQTTKRGNRLVSQREQEWGWYNPKRARLVTNNGGIGSGTAGDGFDYLVTYKNAEGKFVTWPGERFTQVLDRLTTYSYTGSGLTANPTGMVVQTTKYFRVPKGVRTVGADPAQTNVPNSYVYDDDNSFATLSEEYGAAEEQRLVYTFATTGPRTRVDQDTYTYRGIGCRVDGPSASNRHVRFDGKGQVEATAPWRKVETKTNHDLLSNDKLVQGKVENLFAWSHAVKADGEFDWGGSRSDADTEEFGYIESEATTVNAINEGQAEEIKYPAEGGRVPRLFLGTLPSTLYSSSSWTAVQMQPYESILEDPTALEWFGFQRESFMQEYCQSAEEALTVITNRRRRAMCRKYEVVRPDHAAQVGDTVRFVSFDDAVDARCIVASKRRQWGAGKMPMATYGLEEWAA